MGLNTSRPATVLTIVALSPKSATLATTALVKSSEASKMFGVYKQSTRVSSVSRKTERECVTKGEREYLEITMNDCRCCSMQMIHALRNVESNFHAQIPTDRTTSMEESIKITMLKELGDHQHLVVFDTHASQLDKVQMIETTHQQCLTTELGKSTFTQSYNHT